MLTCWLTLGRVAQLLGDLLATAPPLSCSHRSIFSVSNEVRAKWQSKQLNAASIRYKIAAGAPTGSHTLTIHNPALASGQIEAENLSAQSHGLSLL